MNTTLAAIKMLNTDAKAGKMPPIPPPLTTSKKDPEIESPSVSKRTLVGDVEEKRVAELKRISTFIVKEKKKKKASKNGEVDTEKDKDISNIKESKETSEVTKINKILEITMKMEMDLKS